MTRTQITSCTWIFTTSFVCPNCFSCGHLRSKILKYIRALSKYYTAHTNITTNHTSIIHYYLSIFKITWHVVLCCPLQFPSKWCSVRIYLHLFVGGLMSYLRYLCLIAYSGVQHILCCISVLFFSSCVPMLSVSLDCSKPAKHRHCFEINKSTLARSISTRTPNSQLPPLFSK
jgi:hypothetical protein